MSVKRKTKPASAQEQFALAFYYAMKAHESQFRKGTGRPYIEHPMRAAALLLEMGAPKHLVAAGFLHDVVEDSKRDLAEIRRLFGSKTAALVLNATEDKTLDWEKRKSRAIKYLASASYETVLLNLADKLDNLRSIRQDHKQLGEEIWKKFSRPKESQKRYYSGLRRVFRRRLRGKPQEHYALEFEKLTGEVFG